jgi:2,5-diketo-D-gluconate reductase A
VAHGKTPAQVVLRWHIELGNVMFPKSVTVERLQENIEIFDFALSTAEMEQLEAVDRGERIGADPDTFVRP